MKIAGVQYCAGSSVADNLRRAEEGIAAAAAGGARLVVLPENFALYGGDYRALAEQHHALLGPWLADQARRHGLWLLAGSVPRLDRPDGSRVPAPRVRTVSLLLDPNGTVTARYDKLHLFDANVGDAQGQYCESARFEPGRHLTVARVDDLPVGLAICYDLRFPALARCLADRGAELLIYPSAFTATTGAAHWHLLLRARAVETGCHVLGVNQCGQHSPRRASYGHSLLVDPWGDVVAECDAEPGVLLTTLDRARLRDIRARLPMQAHQRLKTEPGEDFDHD